MSLAVVPPRLGLAAHLTYGDCLLCCAFHAFIDELDGIVEFVLGSMGMVFV